MRKYLTFLLIPFIFASLSFADVSKGLIGKDDIKLWDGKTSTFTRVSSSGRHLTLQKPDWMGVDVLQVYGGGTNRTDSAISDALSSIGTTNKVTVFLSPGTWVVDQNVDWSSYVNVKFNIPPGAIISHGAYTINIPNPIAEIYQIFSGTGTITISGEVKEVYPEWWGENTTPGTTDMTAELQAAIDSGAKTISFQDESYVIDTISKTTEVHLHLNLSKGTTLFHKASATGSLLSLSDADSTLRITGGTIDGNMDNNNTESTAFRIIDVPIDEIEINDVDFQNITRGAIRFQNTAISRVLITNSTFTDGNFYDAYTGSDDPCVFIDGYKGGTVKIINNKFVQTTDHGSDVTMHPSAISLSGTGAGYIWIQNNYFQNLGNSQGSSPNQVVKIYTYSNYVNISDNVFIDSSTASIVANCPDTLVVKNNRIDQYTNLSAQSSPAVIYSDNNDRTYGNDDNEDLGGWEIEGNDIEIIGTTDYSSGIYVIGSVATGEEVRNVTVNNNTIKTAATTGNGIGVYATVEIEGINITGNKIAGLFGHGIKIAGDVNDEVDGNYLNPVSIIGNQINNATYGILSDTDDDDISFTISNNNTYSIVTQDIDIEQCQAIQGTGNSWQRNVAAKTSNYTVALEDWGRTFSNTGASGTIVFQGPAYGTAPVGFEFTLTATSANAMDHNPDDNDQIFPCTNAAGDKCRLAATIGTSATFKLVGADGWSVISSEGTLSDQD